MKIALFLGAGASVSLGKPTTEQFKNRLKEDEFSNLEDEIFQSFITHPRFKDIEYSLQAIKEILTFSSTKGGWYFDTDGISNNYQFSHGGISYEGLINRVEEVYDRIEREIFENYRWNPKSNENLLQIYGKIFDFLNKESEKINVFSTNYDKAIEQFCNLNPEDFICIDGFERDPIYSEFAKWTGNFNPILEPNQTKIFLYKLHGSLNWKEHVEEGVVKTNEESISNDRNFTENIVIYPTLTPKEEEDSEPHKSIIEKFKAELKKTDVCISIGYSFRDSLNKSFLEFLARGKTKLIVISPSAIVDTHENLLEEKLNEEMKEKYSKLIGKITKYKKNDRTVSKIYCFQKYLKIETIDDLLKDIKKSLISKPM